MDSSFIQRLYNQLPTWRVAHGQTAHPIVPRWLAVGFAIAAGVLLIAVGAAFFLDEPLRRRMERNLNSALKGYSVRIGALDFHPIGLSLDLEDLVIRQNENPEPPVAHISSLAVSVDWSAILRGRVVANWVMDSPKLYINRHQANQEVEDETPIKERGWQRAVAGIYPLTINHFAIYNGQITYIDEGSFPPLELTAVNLSAANIRNVISAEGVYPSPVHLDAVVFRDGKLELNGNADFLAEPHVGFKTDVAVQNVALKYFEPILRRENLTVQQGSLSANGNMEYAANTKYITITELRASDVKAQYLNRSPEAAPAKAARKVDTAAKEYSGSPSLAITVNQTFISGSLGFVNLSRSPRYRIFWDPCEIQISNFTNRSEKGLMTGKATGRFLGSGKTLINLAAKPNRKGLDIDLSMAIQDTDMKLMNDLFRSHGNFDVVGGRFSFFSEMTVRNGHISGYVKPLFQDADVYDHRQDNEKNLFRKLYEGAIGGLSLLFRNIPRKEVATNVPITGELSNPEASAWETVIGLVQNAFFKAILPGFEREAGESKKRR